ncbi:pra like protein [Mycobacteroides abscessus subsp. abscessus]|nr:pra like protein [Mycobacteroides abscessus subsp. abscessus]
MSFSQGIQTTAHAVSNGYGLMTVSGIQKVQDFNAIAQDGERPQKIDEKSQLPVWQVTVLDADPEAKAAQKTFAVKILSASMPVLPEPKDGMPFPTVDFENLTVTPYVVTNGNRPSIGYSFKATGIKAAAKSASATSKGE